MKHHDLIGTGSGNSVISATDLARRPYWFHPALTEIVQNALLDVSAAA